MHELSHLRRSCVFFVNLEQISHGAQVFPFGFKQINNGWDVI